MLLQHFSGNIDAWDPAVVNALAADRPVIAFDNAGVGRSTGQTPDNVAAMARDAVDFIRLLGLTEVDLLGFSLGGFIAQQIAAEHGPLVRKLILVGCRWGVTNSIAEAGPDRASKVAAIRRREQRRIRLLRFRVDAQAREGVHSLFAVSLPLVTDSRIRVAAGGREAGGHFTKP